MLKHLELSTPTSCFNKAKHDEMIFVLLARDDATPATIRFWVSERLRLGKNKLSDPQIVEAEECALRIEHGKEQRELLLVRQESLALYQKIPQQLLLPEEVKLVLLLNKLDQEYQASVRMDQRHDAGKEQLFVLNVRIGQRIEAVDISAQLQKQTADFFAHFNAAVVSYIFCDTVNDCDNMKLLLELLPADLRERIRGKVCRINFQIAQYVAFVKANGPEFAITAEWRRFEKCSGIIWINTEG